MLALGYNVSFQLRKNTETIDTLRSNILLLPLQPRFEQRLKWDMQLSRIKNYFSLYGNPVTKHELAALFTTPNKSVRDNERAFFHYKAALDYIAEEWLANPASVTQKAIRTLIGMLGIQNKNITLISANEDLVTLLEYLDTHVDHPVILSGLAFIKIREILPQYPMLAHLFAYLHLYKHGYDVKRTGVYESYWTKNPAPYNQTIQDALQQKKLTPWLEFFAYSLEAQLLAVYEKMTMPNVTHDAFGKLWRLTDRQKQILRLIQEPGSQVTNRKVQQNFSISQITASRDLAKLCGLGFLISHGKGRSVYYIKS